MTEISKGKHWLSGVLCEMFQSGVGVAGNFMIFDS